MLLIGENYCNYVKLLLCRSQFIFLYLVLFFYFHYSFYFSILIHFFDFDLFLFFYSIFIDYFYLFLFYVIYQIQNILISCLLFDIYEVCTVPEFEINFITRVLNISWKFIQQKQCFIATQEFDFSHMLRWSNLPKYSSSCNECIECTFAHCNECHFN